MEVSEEKDLGETFDQQAQLTFGSNANKVVTADNSRSGCRTEWCQHV